MSIDLAKIGRELKKPVENINSAVKLLDDGNTIPFITRFRKDQTGGLNEEQLLVIKTSVAKLRALADRKTFIAKSIESQGKLNDKISAQIDSAETNRELEYIYLSFKPKKQTLATVARQNGLEPLAIDILEGQEPEKDLASRATDFVRVDKNLNSIDEVITGVGHILAEKFSDNTTLRNELRDIIGTGSLTTRLVEIVEESTEPVASSTEQESATKSSGDQPVSDQGQVEVTTVSKEENAELDSGLPDAAASGDSQTVELKMEKELPEVSDIAQPIDLPVQPAEDSVEVAIAGQTEDSSSAKETSSSNSGHEEKKKTGVESSSLVGKKKKKKKKKKKAEDPYKEYHEFSHPLAKMPYHKTLAINRGEKNGRLKIKIKFDDQKFLNRANETLISKDHPFGDFLRSCVKDSVSRLVAPSLEREIRREITEAAEKHAVGVFARNLKNLLLQSPVREHRVLAIDPGYKRGCSVAVLDGGGQLLENAHVFVVGNDQRRVESKQKLVGLINQYSVSLIAIGNGAACREVEQMVSDLISECFTDKTLRYAIVNEAGASFYSTSEVGREDFPDLSPAVRSAVSIGRRLIDPLSELVKISPANIGIGLYQHDVKAKHLSESLDDVVQFCVNRVGVDVNTASTSLLKYVSGLNQLTARRIYEYRKENGSFKNREQLKNVSGLGDATFVQSAGFLRIHGGDQPLDTTAVHPECYDTTARIFEKIGATVEELFPIASSVSVENYPEQNECQEKTAVSREENPEKEPVPTEAAARKKTDSIETESTELQEQPAANGPRELNDVDAVDETGKSLVNVKSSGNVPESEPLRKPRNPKLTAEQIERRRELVKSIREVSPEKLSEELGVGQLLMRDILQSICKPEYDPRVNVNRPVFRSGIIKLDDLKTDMCLDAQVVNVVDFGVFVDIGLGTSCLVHVSQLANYFIRDPHCFFAIGDVLKVWVTTVDSAQRRVKLTAVQPQSLRPKRTNRKPYVKSKFQKPTKPTAQKRFSKPRRKPKPVKPITDDMLKGASPMTSFSDLAQFYNKQPGDENDKKSK